MEGPGGGGWGFRNLCVEFGLVAMCPRLRTKHRSVKLKNDNEREASASPLTAPPQRRKPSLGTLQLGVTPAERPEDGDDAFGLTEADVVGRLEGQACGGLFHCSPRLWLRACV